ncbi:MAG: hypothetical protein JJT94_15455 [Bernardetiaceae bacterium]|nr:hypothetical protein [Bernardetiaceae bacterium]
MSGSSSAGMSSIYGSFSSSISNRTSRSAGSIAQALSRAVRGEGNNDVAVWSLQ